MPKTEETTTKYEKPIESTTKYEVPTQNTSEKVYEYSPPEPYYKVVMDRVHPEKWVSRALFFLPR